MDELEKVAELQKLREEHLAKWLDVKERVTRELYKILINLNEKNPAKLLYNPEKTLVDIDDYDFPKKEGLRWKIRQIIYFENQDTNKTCPWDFGSSFDLYITNLGITLNHGSCGSWGKDDKGQLSRLHLMSDIFDNEENIIQTLDPLIDFTDYKQYCDARSALDQINRAIAEAKRRQEEAELLKDVVPGKYFANIGNTWKYGKDENGKETVKRVKYYYNFEKIDKITDKNFLTSDDYGYHYRRDRSSYIFRIKNKSIHVVDSKDAVPPEEEGSN